MKKQLQFSTKYAELHSDLQLLLFRALAGKDLVCFGEDGGSIHGYCPNPQKYTVLGVSSTLIEVEDDGLLCLLELELGGYHASNFGHMCGDRNLLISLDQAVAGDFIEKGAFAWAPISVQEPDVVALFVDIKKVV